MKFLPIPLVILFFLAVPLSLMRAHADEPIEVASPPGDAPANQVLEIPPACEQDGAPAVCEDPGPDSAADSAGAAPAANLSGASSAAPAADPSAASAAAQAASAAGDLGTVQDYQEQVDSGLPYSPGVLAPYGVGSAEPYPRLPPLAAAPMPIAPFVGAAPFVPSVVPATGPIVFGRAAWMPAPRPFTPMTMRPMGAPGMPRGFRLR
jgi:hypothetical protein